MNTFNSSRGLAPIIIILIIASVLVIGGGAYYVVKNRAPQAPTTSQDISEPGSLVHDVRDMTTERKAYRNEEYRVVFEYPSSLEEIIPSIPGFSTATVFSLELNEIGVENNSDSIIFAIGNYDKIHNGLGVIVPKTVTTVGALKSQISKTYAKYLPPWAISRLEIITTQNGTPGLLVDSSGEGGSYRTIYFLRNGQTYFFNSFQAPIADDELLLQIAKTFQFLNK